MTIRKKILLVSNGFYPELSPRSFRATELAKEFSRQGYEVTVISKYRKHDYSGFLRKYPIKFKMWRKSILTGSIGTNSESSSLIKRYFFRLLLLLFEYPVIEDMFHVKNMLKQEHNYDLLISFAVPYPVHWGVAWARTDRNKIARVWIADCSDPFMGNVLDTFKKPFYFKYLEKWFFRKADYISIPLVEAKSGYYPEFHKKIIVIPQGFDFKLENKKKEDPENEVPTFAYAGGFLKGSRDPGKFMDFIKDLKIPFKFVVFTRTPQFISKYISEMNGKLSIHDYIPRQELLDVLSGMDFLINFDNNTKLNSPSKLIDYLIVNRPVLNIKKKLNKDDFLDFINGDYRNKMLLPKPDKYHIKNIAGKFISYANR